MNYKVLAYTAMSFAVAISNLKAGNILVGSQTVVFKSKGRAIVEYSRAKELLLNSKEIEGFVTAYLNHNGKVIVVSISKITSKLEEHTYGIIKDTLPDDGRVTKDNLLVSSRGKMFILPQGGIELKSFDVDDTVPPSVQVSALPLNGKACVVYQKSRHGSDEYATCAILDSSNGTLLDSFPISQFFAAPDVSEVCWINERYVLCVSTTIHGPVFDILDTKEKRLLPLAETGAAFHPDIFRIVGDQLFLLHIIGDKVNSMKVDLK